MSLVKKASDKTKQAVKQVAKDVRDEMLEIPKSVPSQVTGGSVKSTSGLFGKGVVLPKKPSPKSIDVRKDAKNFPKTFTKQLFGKKEEPAVEAMLSKTKKQDDEKEEKEVINAKPFEQEIETARQKRLEQEKKWEEEQQELMAKDELVDEEDRVLPSSGPRKGPALPGAKTPKTPETRKSRH